MILSITFKDGGQIYQKVLNAILRGEELIYQEFVQNINIPVVRREEKGKIAHACIITEGGNFLHFSLGE